MFAIAGSPLKNGNAELRQNPDAWRPLLEAARSRTITLLYSAQHVERNNAAALREFLIEQLRDKK